MRQLYTGFQSNVKWLAESLYFWIGYYNVTIKAGGVSIFQIYFSIPSRWRWLQIRL